MAAQRFREALAAMAGADEDLGDRALNRERSRAREQSRELVEDVAVGDAMAGERLEGARLRPRAARTRDLERDRAQLRRVGDRPVAQIGLHDLHLALVAARERLQRAGAPCRVTEARERRVGGAPRGEYDARKARALAIEATVLVERADELHLAESGSARCEQVAHHPNLLGAPVGR